MYHFQFKLAYIHGQIRVDSLIFYYTCILSINPFRSIVYNNEVDKSMDKKFPILYLHEIAFSLIPQEVFCTKAKDIRESKKRNMILKCLWPDVRCVAP